MSVTSITIMRRWLLVGHGWSQIQVSVFDCAVNYYIVLQLKNSVYRLFGTHYCIAHKLVLKPLFYSL